MYTRTRLRGNFLCQNARKNRRKLSKMKKIKKNHKKRMDYIKKSAQLGNKEAENYLTKKKK